MKKSTISRLFCIACVVILSIPGTVSAQKWGEGRFSGSFETNSIWYVPDDDIGAQTPDDRIGTNNYFKLEYTNGRLTVGAQFEYYGPVLQGLNTDFKNGKIMTKYATWADDNYSITAGDIFDQFGNGIVLRTWEDRYLGFNNSIEGVRVTYNYNNFLAIKGIWGRPRYAMTYLDTQVRAFDMSLDVSNLTGMNGHYLALEGSFVNRYNDRKAIWLMDDLSNNMNMWSGRLNYDSDFGLYARLEAAGKEADIYGDEKKSGSAQFFELGYNGKGFGILLTGRRLKYMGVRLTDESIHADNNMLNYLPSLSRQYTYMLTNLNPHQVIVGDFDHNGEQGGTLDFFYNFKRGSSLGGKYGMKLHLNGSAFWGLDRAQHNDRRNLTYADASIDIEKKWNRNFETTFLYSYQGFNPTKGNTAELLISNIFVADLLYKFNSKTSLRVELQYLQSDDYYDSTCKGDWWGALAEVSIAPKWSFFASDMYNWGNDEGVKEHYYNGGFSFSQGRTRVALSYGRNRQGYVCSGGVCRLQPAFTGLNFTMTTSF